MPPKDKKHPLVAANSPSTPLPTPRTNMQPSPPGAPQKPPLSAQKAASHAKGSSPSTPKPTGSPPGSATPRPVAATAQRTTPSATEPPPVLLPAAHLHQTSPSATALTILQAFSAPLPTFKMARDFVPTLGKHRSSALVGVTDPPRFWSEVRVDHYLSVADSYLAKVDVKSKLSLHYAPSLEPTFRVRREADVVTYAATHLTHTVNIAIGGLFPDAVESVSEVEVGQCRPDFIWRAAGSKDAQQAFAILEMKITGGIDPAIFRRATEAKAHAADQAAEEKDTLFRYDDGSEYSAIKQMATYAHSNKFDTQYVALFDGTYLFLGVFSKGMGRIPLLKGTLLPCYGDQGRHTRKALLGWLIEAKLEKQQGRNHCVRRFTRQLPARGHTHRGE
ncbi:hypothetical protein BT67DRAFT_462049 [Trichocladium antarcticum]|uniref:Uncharacterized protein n=1 Tax=Trichocladium antarcticum TaxID=1450529 RepID=A0AAN6UL95_9PEZI|nr:hypothetical protein BT67DRAFT_462049 [Trichocladium antarcticum]